MNAKSILRIAGHVHWRRFDSEIVLIDLKGGGYYGLSEVAAAAFERLAAGKAATEVIDDLVEVYDVGRAQVQSDVDGLLGTLVGLGLVVEVET
jgi:Coenzyme PQQ synthesis protein D (PqqD)